MPKNIKQAKRPNGATKKKATVVTSKTDRKLVDNNSFGWINILAFIGVLVIAGLIGFVSNNYKTSKTTTPAVAAAQSISYNGEDGKNALDLLKDKADIQTQDSSMGTFVIGINNTIDTDTHYWMFYVNGELASSTPDQYVTKNSDRIEWRYDDFSQ